MPDGSPLNFNSDDPCPRARLLAGSYQCPCHGIHKAAAKVKAEPKAKLVTVRRPPRPPKPVRIPPMSSAEDQEACRALYNDGVSIKDLAQKFSCSTRRIKTVLGDAYQPKGQRRLTSEEIVDMARRQLAGESIVSIASLYECDRWVVYQALGKKRGEARPRCEARAQLHDLDLVCAVNHYPHPSVPHTASWRDGDLCGQYRIQWND